jgi:septum formation protein
MRFLNEVCHLEGKKVILASQSPRRIEMLHSIGLEFEIYPARVDENPLSYRDEIEYARLIARSKAGWVHERRPDADLIIAADTIVVKDGKIFGKPRDQAEARAMLQTLSGTTHQVITGICLRSRTQEIVDHEITEVFFAQLFREEIEIYLASGEPFDKAGGYGIQGFASPFIERVEGCYFNVVGFPIARFYRRLKEIQL